MLSVTRKSAITGKTRTKRINVRSEDLKLYESGAVSAQDALPYLSTSDREFIICGITRDEWKDAFSKELSKIVNDKVGLY